MPQHSRKVGVDLVHSVLSHPFIVVGFVVVFAGLGYFASSLQAERYTATARLFLSSSSPFDGVGQADFINDPDRYAVNQTSLMLSTPVLSSAVTEGRLDVEPDDLREAVTIVAGRGDDVVTIEATAASPTTARDQANAIAEAYRAFKTEEVERQTQELLAVTATDEDSAAVLQRAAAYGDGVALFEPAITPEEPSHPQPVRDGIIAALIGLAAGMATAVVVETLAASRRLRARDASQSGSPEQSDASGAAESQAPARPSPLTPEPNGHTTLGSTRDEEPQVEASPVR